MIRLCLLMLFIPFSSFVLLGQDVFDAVKKGDLAATTSLLEKNPQLIHTKDDQENMLLHYAAAGGYREVAEAILAAGASIDEPGQFGRTPVLIASMNGHLAMVDFLITKRANIFIKDVNGSAPLSVAISNGNSGLVESIVRHTLLGDLGETGKRAVLHQVALGGLEILVEKMIARGIDVSSQNDEGGTLLHSAVRGGLLGTTTMLLERGFQVNARDSLGRTPLHYAILNNNEAFATVLVDRGADVNLPDADDRTPLHIAEDWANQNILTLLVDAGAKRTERKIYRLEKGTVSPSQPRVEITYLGNCSFMVARGKNKLLFDVEQLNHAFLKPSLQDAFYLMEASTPPFDGIESVFISHAHADHTGFREIISLLQKQSHIRMLSTTDTKEGMKEVDSLAFETLADRIKTVDLAYGKTMKTKVDGMETEIISLCHAGAPGSMLKILGFVVNLDGVRVFFLSDIDPGNDVNAAALKEWGKKKEEIDILIAASPILYDPTGVALVKESIRPKHIIAMNVAPTALQSEQMKCRRNFPQTIFFRDCMERKFFR
jgi:ankyrin repeat protein/L-ascorbate metabolism protein UlaG (beta-lactamase superfamily)